MSIASHTLRPCRLSRGVLVLWLFFCGWAASPVSAQTATNRWLSLKDLLNKWEKTPLNDVLLTATNGDLTAEHYVGYCYAEGLRTDRNPKAAVYWYERALRSGYLPSANNLGVVYQRGLLGASDWEKAAYYYNYAADRGLVKAQSNLGFLYQARGRPQEAFQAFQKAADDGSFEAMTQLYLCYYDGNGVAVDRARAMEWLVKAAHGGDAYAQCLLGYHCEFPDWQTNAAGQMTFEPKLQEAAHWYKLSADQDWAGGQYHLGLLYLKGTFVELDEERGLELVRAAADKGIDEAVRDLAGLYAQGIGEPRNENDTPMKLLERDHAWEDLMTRYEFGLGTAPDLVVASACYCKMILSDTRSFSSDGLAGLAEFKPRHHIWGNRVSSVTDRHGLNIYGPPIDSNGLPDDDLARVLSLYLKSAKGDGGSARQLAGFYLNGNHAPKSAPKAWAWLTIAVQYGCADASAEKSRLETQMTPDELKAGGQFLAEYTQDLKPAAAAISRSF